MADTKKKLAAGGKLYRFACVAALVGLVGTVICSVMSTQYNLNNFQNVLIAGAAAVLLIVIAQWAPTKLGNYDLLSTICALGAIAASGVVLRQLIMDRATLAAGLFTYDSANNTGWSVFYVTVVGLAGYLLAIFALIIGSFLKGVKE